MKYEYRGIKYPVEPEIVSNELERIRLDNDERLMPADVVEAARQKNAPLHPCFEWDNKAAGENYRLWQARQLIKSVRIIEDDGQKQQLYFHVRIVEEEKTVRFYQNVSALVQRPTEYLACLAEFRQHLDALMDSMDKLKRAAAGTGGETDLQKLGVIIEALATARTVAEHLQ